MKERIISELARIELEAGVRMLLAVESGSRAWGFASPDSDFDVRFIYAHPRDWYLTVFEGHDVMQAMLPGDLDLSGWDLRKALRLFSKCNPGLNEWLGSPIVYLEHAGFAAHLRELLPGYFNPLAAIHHYRSMADGMLREHLVAGRIPIKKLFYVLRPLLACRWIERTLAQPPTEFSALCAVPWVSAAERQWIEGLLAAKAAAVEKQPIVLADQWALALRSELDHYKSAAARVAAQKTQAYDPLDAVLRNWLSSEIG